MAKGFLPLFQSLNTPAQFYPPAMGAEACKDMVFVLDFEMAFSLSGLESSANESKSHRPDSYMELHSSPLLVFEEDPNESESWTNKI